MPLLTAPLLPALGMRAFLGFNVAVLAGLSFVLYELSARAAAPGAAAAGTLATVFGSFLILYDYNYSPDLFACLLLALSILAAARGAAGWSGLLGGLAAFARTSNVFLLPLLLGFVALRRPRPGEWPAARRRPAAAALLFAAGAALPLAAQAGLNQAMFGSPLVSPYTRILTLEEGRIVLWSHVSDFDNPILEGIAGQLLDPGKGLLFTAPVLLAAVPGFVLWFRRRPGEAVLCLVVGEFLFLLFSRYRWWPTSHAGNRFLMPLVALGAPAVSCAAGGLLELLAGRRRALAADGPEAAL
jgi:hypothetical protein